MVRTFPGYYRNDTKVTYYAVGGFTLLMIGFLAQAGIVVGLGIFVLLLGFIDFAFFRMTKRKWLDSALREPAVILEKKHIEADDEGAYYIHPRYYNGPTEEAWYLVLGMLPCQIERSPNEKQIEVKITREQYYRYEGSTFVIIRYSPDNPFVFLLEDEV